MKALMVQGTSSWAGKSLLVTALARHFARLGVRVAPFKAQNMSNNARVVDGGEIGTAQWLQALAAGAEPDVRMNPVLVKPEADDRSQVVVLGHVDPDLSRSAWRGRAAHTWPVILDALHSLMDEFELVVIEGAGSPAETNLWDCDVANMRVAHAAGAPVLLVTDIDRGGAFAHLYGTWSMLRDDDRALVRGFVLNKFRGDPALLAPAPEELEGRTGVPVVGVVPWIEHALPDEDGAAITTRDDDGPVVAVIRYPTASNLDEFKVLEGATRLRWAVTPSAIADADLVVLPGSKHVSSDIAWLRERGFADALATRAAARRPLLAICGGLQMLGTSISDPHGVDGNAVGLGLLPVTTTFSEGKTTRPTRATFGCLAEPWSCLSGVDVDGYEIRHGTSTGTAATALSDGLGFVRDGILGVYLHGLFENEAVRRALLGIGGAAGLEDTFEQLADVVEASVDMTRVGL